MCAKVQLLLTLILDLQEQATALLNQLHQQEPGRGTTPQATPGDPKRSPLLRVHHPSRQPLLLTPGMGSVGSVSPEGGSPRGGPRSARDNGLMNEPAHADKQHHRCCCLHTATFRYDNCIVHPDSSPYSEAPLQSNALIGSPFCCPCNKNVLVWNVLVSKHYCILGKRMSADITNCVMPQ